MRPIGADTLVALLEAGLDRVVLIDCRPFVDYNTSHILEAVNVNCSKLMKRRLQQDKVQITELLQHAAKRKVRQRPLLAGWVYRTWNLTGTHRTTRVPVPLQAGHMTIAQPGRDGCDRYDANPAQ